MAEAQGISEATRPAPDAGRPECEALPAGGLLNATQVADLLGMRVDYVYELCRRNEIPHLRFGRTLRFRSEAINEWLARLERGPRA